MDTARTIRVTGKGLVRLHPDRTCLTITLSGTEPEYADALARAVREAGMLKAAFAPLGFAASDLKTLQFHVEPEYEGETDKQGRYRQRFVGYRAVQSLKLSFDSDNELLGRTLYAMAHAGLQPEFQLSYTVRDPETAKNALLGAAVADAAAKARVLAEAAGVRLGTIQTVDYSWGRVELEAPVARNRMFAAKAEMADGFSLEIEPDDIEVSDAVTVIWSID